jgi:diacylglycerol kinase family enzyme
MRATLFHNPTAGNRIGKEDILAAMKLANFDTHYVSVKNDDVKKALEKKADLIVIAGGDGTITEVVTKMPDRSIPVAIFPLGTANNIARSFGIAGTPQELVEAWKIDHTHPLDVGLVKASRGTSRFVEGFGVGLFAEFLKAADKHEKPKGAEIIFARGARCWKSGSRQQSQSSCRLESMANHSMENFWALR